MKKKLLCLAMLFVASTNYAQFTTDLVEVTTGYSVKIDTNATTVTVTLVGPSTSWLGMGFGGGQMSNANDMIIHNSSTNRDYNSSGNGTPSADAAAQQSWTQVSDNVVSGIRTYVASRPLATTGDYAFANSNTTIPIIWAFGSGTALQYHANRGAASLTRSPLSTTDFSLNATTIFPNPTQGKFSVKTNTALNQIDIYTQTGALVKTIEVKSENETEVIIEGLATGIYLLELKNSTEKSWKKIIVE